MMKTSIKKLAALVAAAAVSASMMVPAYAEETAREVINGATNETIATAMSQYLLADTSKLALYSNLPECDRNEINERVLKNIPYADDAALDSAYQTAIEYTTQVDGEYYDTVHLEDFADGFDTEVWNVTNTAYSPEVSDKAVSVTLSDGTTVVTKERQSLNISGEENSSMFTWNRRSTVDGKLGGQQTLTTSLEDPNVVITSYFKLANLDANGNNYWELRINNEDADNRVRIGAVGSVNASKFIYSSGKDNFKDKEIADFDSNWHKVEIDGASEPGYITGYFDGQKLFTVAGTINTLALGIFSSKTDHDSMAFTDNISIATLKPEDNFLAKFNGEAVSEKHVKFALPYINKSESLYSSLPECDRTEIVERLESGRPYATIDALKTAYQTALEYTTQVDKDLYTEVLLEDFADGIDTEVWTVSENAPVAGSTTIAGNARQAINISGTDNMSMAKWGPSLAVGEINSQKGGVQNIYKEIEDSNVAISGYFYHANHDGYNYFQYSVNDTYKIGAFGTDQYYVYTADGKTWTRIAPFDKKWHKVEFDGITEPGFITAYFDGEVLFRIAAEITSLRVGSTDKLAGYDIFFADNISIATEKKEEKVTISSRGVEIEGTKIPSNVTTLAVKVDNWEKTTDYIVATYKDKQLVNVSLITKDAAATAVSVSVSDVDEMKVLRWDSVSSMLPAGDIIHLTK